MTTEQSGCCVCSGSPDLLRLRTRDLQASCDCHRQNTLKSNSLGDCPRRSPFSLHIIRILSGFSGERILQPLPWYLWASNVAWVITSGPFVIESGGDVRKPGVFNGQNCQPAAAS
uniref:Uncharacterized protein n=1 Tax=Coccidioides posadasii RMSCC 3488 TaxID=454284 RepID=A0A0J6EZL6_COCPO|nr:hypothetical protein CPAG_02401 [Coccidioides posadasii RMSCC 3488]